MGQVFPILGADVNIDFKEKFTCSHIQAGLISGLFLTLVVLSFANFIFVGALKPYLPLGFGIILFSSIPLLLIINFFSHIRGVIAYPFAIVCVFLATILKEVSQHPLVNQDNLWQTTIVIIVITTLSLSLFTFLASHFKLGNTVRYIPFPVLAGMLSAIGCLMILKAIRSITNETTFFSGVIDFFSPEHLPQSIVSLALAAFLLWQQKWGIPRAVKWGAYFIVGAFIILAVSQDSFSNWIIQIRNIGFIWPPMSFSENFNGVPFSILSQFLPELLALNTVFVTSLIVNMNGVEAFLKKDVDLNRELKITSWANLFTGFLGGIGGCMTATQTIPNIKKGAVSFYAALAAASVVVITMIFGSLGGFYYIPNFLLTAIPIYLGSMFLLQWLYESKNKLTSYFEWVVLLTTLLTAVCVGLIYGVIIGIIGASALFIYNYSYHDLIMEIKNGKKIKSAVDRSNEEEQLLNELHKQILIVKLNGFLFFGNSFNLLNRLKESIDQGQFDSVKFLIIDFNMISNLDSSFILTFFKIKEVLKNKKITLCICLNKKEIINLLPKDSVLPTFVSEEEALEWVEENFLKNSPIQETKTYYITDYLDFLIPLFEKAEFKKSELVIQESSDSNAMYIVLNGTAREYMTLSNGSQKTIRKMTHGALIGELSYFLGAKTYCSLVAEEDSVLLVLRRERLNQLEKEDPAKMNVFYEIICKIMSDKIVKQSQHFRKKRNK